MNGGEWVDGRRDYVAINERGALLGVVGPSISTPEKIVRYTSLLTRTAAWQIRSGALDGSGEVPFYNPQLNTVLFPLVNHSTMARSCLVGMPLNDNSTNGLSTRYYSSPAIPMELIESMRRFRFLDPLDFSLWFFQDSNVLGLRNIVRMPMTNLSNYTEIVDGWNNSLGVPLSVDASKASPGLWVLGSQSFGYLDRNSFAFRDLYAVSGSNASIAATADGGCWICEPRGLGKVNDRASWTRYVRTFNSRNQRLLGCTPHDEPWLLDTSDPLYDRVWILDAATAVKLDWEDELPKYVKWIVSSVDEAIFASQPNYTRHQSVIWKFGVDEGVRQVRVDEPVSFFAYQALSNRPPVFRSVAARTVGPGSKVAFRVSATDPDGDALTYRAVSLPAGATFDPATRIFTWNVPAWAEVVKAWQASFKPISTRVPLAAAFNARFEAVDGEGNVGRLTASVNISQYNPIEIMPIGQDIVAVDSCPLPSP